MTDDELDAIVKRAHAAALDNGYGEEMRGWTTYEHAVDLGDTEPDLEGQDVFRIEAAVKRMFGFEYDEADVPSPRTTIELTPAQLVNAEQAVRDLVKNEGLVHARPVEPRAFVLELLQDLGLTVRVVP